MAEYVKKMPVVEKVFEAWTAIADGRVHLGEGQAQVESSDGTKGYTVKFDGNTFASDDNATYWRGYPGYPVIVVMMLRGDVPFDSAEAEKWKDVNWKEINTRFKNKYAEAVKFVAEERHIDLGKAYEDAQKVMKALEGIDYTIKRKLPNR